MTKKLCKGAHGCKVMLEEPLLWCSIECACYDKCFNVKTGWQYEIIKEKYGEKVANDLCKKN
jgi:hypothetical protein